MQRIMTSAAIVFAGALLLSGCASGGGSAEPTPDACENVRSEVLDISNGAQNVLGSGGDPSDIQASLEGYSERVDALAEEADDALDALDEKLAEASDFAATLPTDPEAEADADAVAAQQEGIAEAANAVTSACTGDTEG